MSVAEIYINSFKKTSGFYQPTWPPLFPMKVGDYGTFTKGLWDRKGSIAELGLDFDTEMVPMPGKIEHSNGIEYHFDASGGASIECPVKAQMSIRFSGKKTAYIHLVHKNIERLKSLPQVDEQIMAYFKRRQWKKNYAIVTEVVYSQNLITVIDENGGADVKFNCQSLTPNFNLDSVALQFKLTYNKNTSYCCCTDNNTSLCTPMYKVRKIKGLIRPEFQTIGDKMIGMEFDESDYYDEQMDYEFIDLK